MNDAADQHPDQANMNSEPSGGRVDRPREGMDARGRFAKGNKLGRGNPLAGRAAKIRATLLKSLTPQKAKEIAEALIKQASTGDMAAIRELLDRTIGKPAQADVIERLDALERLLEEIVAQRPDAEVEHG